MTNPAVTITGTLTDVGGNPLQGKVIFSLANQGSSIPRVAGTDILAQTTYEADAGANGAWTLTIFGNYQLTNTNTWYSVAIYKSLSQGGADSIDSYQFNVAGTFDLSNLAPISANPTVQPNQPLTAVVTNPPGTQTINTYPLNAGGGLQISGKDATWLSTRTATVGPTGSGAGFITTGTADQTIINSAITFVSAAGGGVVRILGGTYSFTGSINLAAGVSFIVDNVGATTFHIATGYNWTTSPNFIQATGAFLGSQINLSVDQASSVNVINVTTNSDYTAVVADDYLYLMSDDLWEGNGTDLSGRKKGEFVKVNTPSANSFTIFGSTRDSYTTANTARLRRMSWIENIIIRGVQILQDATLHTVPTANALIAVAKCRNVEITGCRLHDFDDLAIQAVDCLSVNIDNNFIYNLTDDAANNYFGYGVVISGASELVRVSDNSFSRVRHAVTSSSGDTSHGVPRNVLIKGNTISHCTNSGIDTHQCGENIAILDNFMSNCQTWGVFNRGRASVIDGNTIDWCGGGISVGISNQTQGGMGASTRVTNNHIRHITHNTYTDVDATNTQIGMGIVINQTDNCIVKGNTIEYTWFHGIQLAVQATNCIIEDNTILNCNQGNSSTSAGIQFIKSLSAVTASITAFDGVSVATLTYSTGGFSNSNYWPGQTITIIGAASAGNNGSFVVTAIPSDTTIQYTNASAVAGDANNGTISFGIGCITDNIIQNNTVINKPASRTDVDTAGHAKYVCFDAGLIGASSAVGNVRNIFKDNVGYGMESSVFNALNTFNFYAGNGSSEGTPIKTVAGVPADSSFVANPQNGVFAINTSTNSLYIRAGGVWFPFGTSVDVSPITFSINNVPIAYVTTSQLQLDAAVANPTIQQNTNVTNSATGQQFSIHAQNCTGTTTTGGKLVLQGGTGTSTPGSVELRSGSNVTMLTVNSVGAIIKAQGTLNVTASPAVTASNFAASAAWGSTPTGPTVQSSSFNAAGRINIISGGAGIVANPTLTFTYASDSNSNTPNLQITNENANVADTGFWSVTSINSTTAVVTYVGTPVSGRTYGFSWQMVFRG